jgi:hypothetical protein
VQRDRALPPLCWQRSRQQAALAALLPVALLPRQWGTAVSVACLVRQTDQASRVVIALGQQKGRTSCL